ncbi:bifunctional lysylphosphatidylglycerol flippase/synthetase MprF [Rathayibacter toxicus]|uniref:bifunctional lysylphosphatidylglycerol flippase/synthetase MprF n=1 Tax=Rathayibacter toxicus TaxID=145458 RepID=UPI001C03B94F|nr:DUF2156 domain-containing protein [Rathayibacter toxicus]QWL33186.1 DUF2156 domain-containing protein [Rathayibacter toxicus]QWL35281.1 DUF2156 domain-containing protein [Rathayibacter toxicus]QWL37412.1 DUF2156 domain-containing protein [Rathayibacter toxicus]QWL39505.1 DUF2156 domain-containing protein [Rathayibacter toxicus]QWL41588.1 DUF2156 domain-containing protein [Rathayibacter toxicus]
MNIGGRPGVALARLMARFNPRLVLTIITSGVRAHPFAIAICALTVTISLAAFIETSSDWGWDILTSDDEQLFQQGRWWTPVTSLLAVNDGAELALLVPLLLIVVGSAEHLMGSVRTAIAYLGGGAAASIAGVSVSFLEQRYLPTFTVTAEAYYTLAPMAAVFCTAMTMSSFTGTLWRRRIRVSATFFTLLLVLYTGRAEDLIFLFGVLIGLALGPLLGGKRPGFTVIRSSHHEIRVLLAAIVAAGSVGPAILSQFGSKEGLLSLGFIFSRNDIYLTDGGLPCISTYSTALGCTELEGLVRQTSATDFVDLAPIAVALLAAWGIWRGRRAGLWIAIALNMLMLVGVVATVANSVSLTNLEALDEAVVSSLPGKHIVRLVLSSIIPLATALTLFLLRGHVRVSSAHRSRRRYLATLATTAIGVLIFTAAGQLLAAQQFSPRPSPSAILAELPFRLIPSNYVPPDIFTFLPDGPWAQIFWYLPSTVFALAVLWATARLLLSHSSVSGAAQRQRARQVLEQGGGDTFSFMTTWAGNLYWFAPNLDAGIAFRVEAGVAVTIGGPFGRDRNRPEVTTGFLRYCGDNGWTPLFYSVDDRLRLELEGHGWGAAQVASEALLRPVEWTPSGKKRQDIRTATNRAAREGLTALWTSWADLSLIQREQVRNVSESWVSGKKFPEMGFTLGGMDELTDPAVRLMLAVEESGRVQAVTSWLPIYGADGLEGYILDFMRRDDPAMNGIIEFLLGEAAEHMKRDGLAVMSLSGAPLAVTDSSSGNATARLLDRIGSALEPAYGFRSLHAFKRKFQPEFEPRWLLYPDTTALPIAGIALTRCYLPQLTLRGAARLIRELRQPES